jgi:hypothetical protein
MTALTPTSSSPTRKTGSCVPRAHDLRQPHQGEVVFPERSLADLMHRELDDHRFDLF